MVVVVVEMAVGTLVHFDETKNKVHRMYAWQYAYRESRRIDKKVIDGIHFMRRILRLEEEVFRNIFTINHRLRIYNERFK